MREVRVTCIPAKKFYDIIERFESLNQGPEKLFPAESMMIQGDSVCLEHR